MSSPVYDLAPDGLPDPPPSIDSQLRVAISAAFVRITSAATPDEAKGWIDVVDALAAQADYFKVDLNPPAEPQPAPEPEPAKPRTRKPTTTATTSKENQS